MSVGVVPVEGLPNDLLGYLLCGTLSLPGRHPFTCDEIFTWDPSSVQVRQAHVYFATANSLYFESQSSYQEALSVAVDGKAEGLFWSVDASAKTTNTAGGSTWKRDAYMVNTSVQQSWIMTRNGRPLSEGFTRALGSLPSTCASADDSKKYAEFFTRYGTHYLVSGAFGGLLTMETTVRQSTITRESQNKCETEISTAFNGVLNEGSCRASVAYEKSTFLKDHMAETHVTMRVLGGQFSGSRDEWIPTCTNFPTLIVTPTGATGIARPVFAPITTLVTDPTRRAAMELALNQFLPTPLVFDEPVVGPQRAVQTQQLITAVRDGFVLGSLNISNHGPRGYITVEADNTPLGSASAHYFPQDNRLAGRASMFVPVRTGCKYLVRVVPTAGSITPSIYWSDLRAGNLQAPSAVPLTWNGNQAKMTKQAETTGFLMCLVRSVKNGSRGEAKVEVDGKMWAGTSQHLYTDHDTQYPMESFCVPIPSGTTYTLSAMKTAENPAIDVYWMPTDLKIGAPEPRENTVVYPAEKDGFLVACISSIMPGHRGYVDVFVGDSELGRTELCATSLVASTSMEFDSQSDTWLPMNTVTVPVQRGQNYLLEYYQLAGAPALAYNFFPINDK